LSSEDLRPADSTEFIHQVASFSAVFPLDARISSSYLGAALANPASKEQFALWTILSQSEVDLSLSLPVRTIALDEAVSLSVREGAVYYLGNLPQEQAGFELEGIIRGARRISIVRLANKLLAVRGAHECRSRALAARYATAQDPDERVQAVFALLDPPSEGAFQTARPLLLQESSLQVLSDVIQFLANLAECSPGVDECASALLMEFANHSRAEVASRACAALRRYLHLGEVVAMLEHLRDHATDPLVRDAARSALIGR
jgi:HEAT repeat protein